MKPATLPKRVIEMAAALEIIRAERRSAERLVRLQADPDTGPIRAGHICKHGVIWPHECKPCADDAWERFQLEIQANQRI